MPGEIRLAATREDRAPRRVARAGAGIGASDADYAAAGAQIASDAAAVFAYAELLVKVKPGSVLVDVSID